MDAPREDLINAWKDQLSVEFSVDIENVLTVDEVEVWFT